MTSEELEALEKLEKAATPGPWDVFADVDLCVYNVIGPAFAPIAVVRTRTIDDPPAEDDDGGHAADFTASSLIVALRNAAPALIAAARENANLRAKLADAEKALDEQAEAVRVLAGEISEWRLAHVCSPVSLIDAPIIRAKKRPEEQPHSRRSGEGGERWLRNQSPRRRERRSR
jgi:hypothetical protein